MASVFFKKVGDNYFNQAGPGQIFELGVTTDGTSWFIQASPDGVHWTVDYSDVFATQVAAQAGLASYVAALNAGTATG